jgi:ABC-type glycerol-3-phosphate transport system substrate-binding protein
MVPRTCILALVITCAGCFAKEQPLPPGEALAQVATRIDAFLAEEPVGEEPPALRTHPDPPENPNEVTFWYPSHSLVSPALARKEVLGAFREQHPDLILKPQYIGDWSVAVQKITVNVVAGDLPDIALVPRDFLARVLHSGLIAPLDDILPAELMDDFPEHVRQMFTVYEQLYALPADGYCDVLLINRVLVPEDSPRTWTDLQESCAKLKSNPRVVLPVGRYPYILALWGAGGEVCDAQRSRLTDPPAREALDFILGLRDAGYARTHLVDSAYGGAMTKSQDHVAMTVEASSTVAGLRRAGHDIAALPVPGKTGPLSRTGEHAFVVFAGHAAAKREAIAAVLDLLTGEAVQGEHAMAMGSVPVRRSIRDGIDDPHGLYKIYEVARATPLVAPWSAVEFELRHYLALAYAWREETP